MQAASIVETTKTFIIDFKAFFFAAELCKFRPTSAMIAVVSVIKTAGIVEDGKQTHHVQISPSLLRKHQAVVLHLMPMFNAMNLGLIEPTFKSIFH